MQIVYARRDDLLGGCLMNLAHSWGFADKLKAELIVIWEDDHPGRPWMPWHEIFQHPSGFYVVPGRTSLFADAFAMPRSPQWSNALKTYPAIFYPHTVHVSVDGDSKEYDEPRVRRLLKTLPIQPEVTQAVEAIAARAGAFTAVHLRRGDDILAILRSDDRTEKFDRACSSFVKRYVCLETYRRAIEANSDGPLLIFSNDHAEAERLAGLLPHRRITYAGDQPELTGLTPMQRDFAEMLLMAKADKIIGTHSNYSRFPRLLGGCPLIAAHPWVSQPHLREFVESTVPERAIPQVLDVYRKIFNRQVPR